MKATDGGIGQDDVVARMAAHGDNLIHDCIGKPFATGIEEAQVRHGFTPHDENSRRLAMIGRLQVGLHRP
jgi:hypothetical protein